MKLIDNIKCKACGKDAKASHCYAGIKCTGERVKTFIVVCWWWLSLLILWYDVFIDEYNFARLNDEHFKITAVNFDIN